MLRRVERPPQELNIVGAYESLNERLARIGAANTQALEAMRAKLDSVATSSGWPTMQREPEATLRPRIDLAQQAEDSLVLGPLSPGLKLGWAPRRGSDDAATVENPHAEFYGLSGNIDQ